MKTIAVVFLFFFGMASVASQECAEITLAELETVFVDGIGQIQPEGSPRPERLNRIHEFRVNCLAPGCQQNRYRAVTVTADIEYNTTTTRRDVRQVDVRCGDSLGFPAWEAFSFTGATVIQSQEQIELLLGGETQTSCAACSALENDADEFNCVACDDECFQRPGLMQCTGRGADQCFSFFNQEGMCVQDCGPNQAPDEDLEQCFCINFYSGLDCTECLLDAWCHPPSRPNEDCSTCVCTECYSGILCDDHPCDPNPCQDSGTCTCTDLVARQPTCECLPQSTGEFCELILDACTSGSNPCLNGGTCMDFIGRAVCSCAEGFMGEFCEMVDICSPNPCQNGGTCTSDGATFSCICPPGFTSPLCEELGEGPCCPNPCRNKGTCVPTGDESGFRCECRSGFVGELCEESPCGNLTCHNGGQCNDSTTCVCPGTRRGDQCQKCEATHIKLATGDCILNCDSSCNEHDNDPFQYDLCRYFCHVESWQEKLFNCDYDPPSIDKISAASDKELWQSVRLQQERAFEWWASLSLSCYPVPEPPYLPPPPADSSERSRSGSGSPMLAPGPGAFRESRSKRSGSDSVRPRPRPNPTQGPPPNECVDEYLVYLGSVAMKNITWFEYTLKTDPMLSEEDAISMLMDLDSASYQEDLSEVYRVLLQYWAAQFSTYCEQHQDEDCWA